MPLLNRLSNLCAAEFHAWLDRIEDREALLKQAIRDMVQSLTEQQPSLPQNELAAFIRDYSQSNPRSSRQAIMLEWEQLKLRRRSERVQS